MHDWVMANCFINATIVSKVKQFKEDSRQDFLRLRSLRVWAARSLNLRVKDRMNFSSHEL